MRPRRTPLLRFAGSCLLLAALLAPLLAAVAVPARAAPSLVRTAAYDQADQVDLAGQLELGVGVNADPGRAMALYCRAAFAGNRSAILHVVGLLLADPASGGNNKAAAAWLHRLQFLERGLLPPRGGPADPCRPEDAPAAWAGPAPTTVPPASLAGLVEALAQDKGVDGGLVRAIIGVESAWQANATSPKGAMGLMQIMPFNFARLALTDPFDPAQNIRAGIAEISRLLGVFRGDVALAVAAYNAGEVPVSRCNCVPDNGETLQFVTRVRSLMDGARPAPGR